MAGVGSNLELSWVLHGDESPSQLGGQVQRNDQEPAAASSVFANAVVVERDSDTAGTIITQREVADLGTGENPPLLDPKLKLLANEVDKFIRCASSFGAMKGAMESLTYFGWIKEERPPSFYSALLRDANETPSTSSSINTSDAELEKFYVAFCNKLEDPSLGLSFFGKIVAKVSFHFMQQIFMYILEDFRTAIEKDVVWVMENKGANDFEELKNLIFTDLERYIGRLTQSYKKASIPKIYDEFGAPIAQDPDSINKDAETHLADPLNNSGYKKEELYSAFTDWLFTKYKPSSHLRQIIIDDLKSIHFQRDSFLARLNPVLSYCMNAFSFLVSLFLGPVERKLDSLIQDYVKKFLSKKLYIETFIQKHLTTSEEDKKKMRIQFLDFYLKFMQEEVDPNLTTKHLPNHEKVRLDGIIKSIFSFLDDNRAALKELIPFDPEPPQVSSSYAGYLLDATTTLIGAAASIATNASIHEYSFVRKSIISIATSIAESSVATNLQKEVILDKSLQLVAHALQVLSTMGDDAPPVPKEEKSVGTYLSEILVECVKIATHTPEQIRLAKVHSIMTQAVGLLKTRTAEFLRGAESCIMEIEQCNAEIATLVSLMEHLGLDLKRIVKEQSANPSLNEENQELLVDFRDNVCRLLQESDLQEALTELQAIFRNATETPVSFEQVSPPAEECRKILRAITELHANFVAPTLYIPSYSHAAAAAIAPILSSSTLEDIAKPVLNMALDPKSHIYGIAHSLMIGALGPKKVEEVKV